MLAATLMFAFLVLFAGPLAAEPVVIQEATAGGLGVTLTTDAQTKRRQIEVTGKALPAFPTIEATCDGKRRTFVLARSQASGSTTTLLYDVPADEVDALLKATGCRLFLPGHVVALPRDARWTAWAGASKGTAPPRTFVARVVDIVDGDTIKVQIGDRAETVRYIGIDAPETTDRNSVVEPGAREAAEVNRHLVGGREVRLELDVQERDRLGRLLAYVWVGDRMVNAELVGRGYAKVVTGSPNVRHQELFLKLQREAREQRAGIWISLPPAAAPPRPAPTPAPPRDLGGLVPLPNGACPATHMIKREFTTSPGARCVYHAPGGLLYGGVTPERCYETEQDARQDGCRPSRL